MTVEDLGPRRGNPRIFELIEHTPKEGGGPTIWAWPQVIDYFKVAGQPVQGPWPPHQEPRPDPTDESLPVAVPDPESSRGEPAGEDGTGLGPSAAREPGGSASPY